MSRVSDGTALTRANTHRARTAIPSDLTQVRPRPSKRLVLCEDGSWLNSQSGSLRASLEIPSNVTRISRAVKPRSRDGIPQVVYYHFGVGSGRGIYDRVSGGVSGEGKSYLVLVLGFED